MQDFIINEDFPNSEIDFDQRFPSSKPVTNTWSRPNGLLDSTVRCAVILIIGSVPNTSTFAPNVNTNFLKPQVQLCMGPKKPITYWVKATWWFTTRKSAVMPST
jgi:hypothetical protein